MKNYKKFTLPITLIIIILLIITIKNNYLNNKDQICINNNCFDIEIAQTEEEREKGLMYRSSLQLNQGMLFIFENEDKHSFWMKNTLIPLDIIWISKDGEIVYIEKSAPPCDSDSCAVYKSNKKALYVLEINSGKSEEFNIKIGDKISFS